MLISLHRKEGKDYKPNTKKKKKKSYRPSEFAASRAQ